MTKDEIYQYLADLGIDVDIVEHRAVYDMGEQVALPYPEALAKTLFLRDDKREHYYLVSVRGDKRLDLKALRQGQGTRKLTFAAPEELAAILHLQPGFVSPFGLLHDGEEQVTFFLDADYRLEDWIGIHPNDNTATLFLKVKDLLDVLMNRGVHILQVNI